MRRWTLSTLRERRNEIPEIGRQHGVRMIRVLGSVSRGDATDATPASDVDLLVDLEQGRSLLDPGGFVADVQDLLGCRVDVVSARSSGRPSKRSSKPKGSRHGPASSPFRSRSRPAFWLADRAGAS